MKKIYSRIISAFVLLSIVFQPLTVFASSGDTVSSENVSSLISRYKDNVIQATKDFYSSIDVAYEDIDSLWDGFVSIWTSTKASLYYGKTFAELSAGLINDYINYLKDNYLFGYFDGDEQYVYLSPQGKLPTHQQYQPPTDDSHGLEPDPNATSWVYNLTDYRGNFPIIDGTYDEIGKRWYFTNNLSGYMFPDIKTYTDIGFAVPCYGNVYKDRTKFGVQITYYMPDALILNSGQFLLGFFSYNNSSYRYLVCHEDGEYIVIDSVEYYNNPTTVKYGCDCDYYTGAPTNDISLDRNYTPHSSWSFSNEPFICQNHLFINTFWGDSITIIPNSTNSTSYYWFYYNGRFVNLSQYNDSLSFGVGSRFKFGGKSLDITFINNEINNYQNIVNNYFIQYPDIDVNMLFYLLDEYFNKRINGMTYEEFLLYLQEQIDILHEDLADLNDIKSALVKMKRYLKNIDDNITHIMTRFDSLFLQSGIFFLDAKLDYMYSHLNADMYNNTNRLINAINNISVSSNGGSGDINFGDFIVDIDASLNLLFTLNIDQKSELQNDINTMKAPFTWIPSTLSGVGSFYNKLISRSAYWSGSSASADFDNSAFNDFFGIEEEASAPVLTGPSGDSSPGPVGSAAEASGSSFIYPVIYLHFGNSTSDIDYGGDVPAIDFSWYAPYKPIVDTLIVAFCWAVFILNIVRLIPSIINGDSNNDKVDASGGDKR